MRFDMSPAPLGRRANAPPPPAPASSGGLGLVWIIVISLACGIVFFMGVGFVLSWRLKHRKQPYATRVYSNGLRGGTTSAMKLSKRKLLGNEGEFVNSSSVVERDWNGSGWWGRDNTESVVGGNGGGGRDMSSIRLSFSVPKMPVLPPLPTYQSFFARKTSVKNRGEEESRRRSRSWVDEDGLHGPEIKKPKRESWLAACRESWFGKPPTLPHVDDVEKIVTTGSLGISESVGGYGGGEETLVIPKRRSAEPKGGYSEPDRSKNLVKEIEDAEELQRGRSQRLSKHLARLSESDMDLRGILYSTERRLRDGTSQSPEKKTPRSSPGKGPSGKTARSHKTTSSQGSINAVYGTPSPSKRTPGAASQNESIGSAANSLIAEATHELELPGGSQSPSRALGGQEWTQTQTQLPVTDMQFTSDRHRSPSSASEASSSLSTVYSANDPEEAADPNDVFVENGVKKSATSRSGYRFAGPRPLGKRSPTFIPEKKVDFDFDLNLAPAPLRPVSRMDNHEEDDATARRQEYEKQVDDILTAASSESSMVTISVHSTNDEDDDYFRTAVQRENEEDGDDEEDEHDAATPRPQNHRVEELSARGASPSTPKKLRMSIDLSSSPLNEEEIMHLLLAQSGKRALPRPPSIGAAAVNLSPEAKGSPLTKIVLPSSSPISSDESHYEDLLNEAPTTPDHPTRRDFSFGSNTTSVSRQPSGRSVKESSPAVGSTVAELRRMNSLISSYSCASLASTNKEAVTSEMGTHKSLGNLRNVGSNTLGVSPSASYRGRVVAPMGSRFYLNIGSPPKHQQNSPERRRPAGSRPSPVSNRAAPGGHGHRRTRSINEGKENNVLFSRSPPKIELTTTTASTSPASGGGLREGKRSSANLGREPSFRSGSPVKSLARLGSVREERSSEKETSSTAVAGEESQDEASPRRRPLDSLYDADGFLIGSPKSSKKKSPDGKKGSRSLR